MYIGFGEPKTVKELRIEWAEHEPRISFKQHVANYVRGEIAKKQAISATGLVAYHLEHAAESTCGGLRERVGETTVTMQKQGMNVAPLVELGMDAADYGLRILEKKGVVVEKRGRIHIRRPRALQFCAHLLDGGLRSKGAAAGAQVFDLLFESARLLRQGFAGRE